MDFKDFRLFKVGLGLKKGPLLRGVKLSSKKKALVAVTFQDLIPLVGFQRHTVSAGNARRYKSNSFAFFCGTSTMCNEFIDTLISQIDLVEFTYPDSGDIPYKRLAEEHISNAPTRFFFYGSESNYVKAGEILKAYTFGHIIPRSGINMWIRNWKNQKYMSWMW